MLEVRFHGRGGCGTVVASKILGIAACKEGKFSLSTPKFLAEKRGAPVSAFVRISTKRVSQRYEVYNPDHVIVLDETLIGSPNVDVASGLKSEGTIIINTTKDPSAFKGLGTYRVATIDATGIALKHGIGSRTSPVVNTAILGAIVHALGIADMTNVISAIKEKVHVKQEANIAAALEAYQSVHYGGKRDER